jgi:AmmeMemoRadiSam system protein A
MEPLSSADSRLFGLAVDSVRGGLDGNGAMHVDTASLPSDLRQPQGVFVTLLVGGELNGCVGTLFPAEPLGAAVARLAWDAAFADPRLPRLRWDDYERLTMKISLLSPLQPLPPMTLDEITASLRPHIDGLLIRIDGRQATFLPAVWDTLPDPAAFVRHLQLKAGIPTGYWPQGAEAFVYTAREFGGPVPHRLTR